MKKRKKRRLKYKNIFIAFSIIILFILSVIYILNFNAKNNIKDNNITKENKEEYRATMVMVGDNLIHDKIYNEAKKNSGGNNYNFKPMIENIKEIVNKYDIAYYNQETILGGSNIGVSSYPAFNSPYEVGDAMIDAGFNLVSLATNHTMDRGEEAILNSRKYWDSNSDVMAVGSYDSIDARNKINIKEINNIKYTMLNYTYGTNGIKIPTGKEYLVNVWPVTGNNPETDNEYQKYKETIKKDIERVRDKVDVLIVAMHWGIEYETTPNNYQIDAAKFLASLGVNIIIGTHPHVIQPIDYIDDTLVIYSLGNFLSAHEVINMDNRVGLMSTLEIVKDNNGIKLEKINNELLYTYYKDGYTDFKVIPFSKMEDKYLSGYKDIYDKYKSIIQNMNNNIEVVPCN